MAAGKSVATCLDLPAYVCIQRTWPSQLQVCSDKHVVAHRAGSKKQAKGMGDMWRPALAPARISFATRLGVTHVAGDADTFFRGILFPPALRSSLPTPGWLLCASRPVSHDHLSTGTVRSSQRVGAGGCVGRRLCAVFGSLARHGEGRRSACSVGGKQEDWSPLRPGGDASYPLHSLLSMSTVCGA